MAMATTMTKMMMLIYINTLIMRMMRMMLMLVDANDADAAEVTTTKSENGWWTEQVDDAAISCRKGCLGGGIKIEVTVKVCWGSVLFYFRMEVLALQGALIENV